MHMPLVQMGKAAFLSLSNRPVMDVRNEDRYVICRLAREPPIPILLMLRTVTILIGEIHGTLVRIPPAVAWRRPV
jgi:hypothetical protein